MLILLGAFFRRVRRMPPRDPAQAKTFTWASAKWIWRNRAWGSFYLPRYWRFLVLRLKHPHIVTEGFVFLGERLDIYARKGYGRMVLGRFAHIGSGNALRDVRLGEQRLLERDLVLAKREERQQVGDGGGRHVGLEHPPNLRAAR